MRQRLARRKHPEKFRRHAVTGALLALLVATPALALQNYDYSGTTMNQGDTGGFQATNMSNGSSDSKHAGVNQAMQMFQAIAALDVGGAIYHGYRGYGNYLNSQQMNDLNSAAWSMKNSLTSVGSSPVGGANNGSGSSITGATDTPNSLGPEQAAAKLPGAKNANMLANMDRGFLYQGETGDIATNLEKASGMSRETFFQELADAEASGLSWDDPNLMDKLEGRYQSFISKIPNQAYRARIERMHDILSVAKKAQFFDEAKAFYTKTRWGDGSGAALAKAAAPALGASVPILGAGAAGAEVSAAADRAPASDVTAARTPADDKTPTLGKDQTGMYLGLEGAHGDELNDFMGQEDSIFRVVSKRYRKLTPMMIGKAL